MSLHEVDKIPLRILTQRRFAKMLIRREKILRFDIKVGEIAATSTAHQNFLADFIRTLENYYAAAPLSGGKRSKKSCCTAAKNDNIELGAVVGFDCFDLLCCHRRSCHGFVGECPTLVRGRV